VQYACGFQVSEEIHCISKCEMIKALVCSARHIGQNRSDNEVFEAMANITEMFANSRIILIVDMCI